MTDNNVQAQAYEQAEIAEKKVAETVDAVENSKMGKNLPTDINSIHITDILKLLMVGLFFNFFPLYLMFGSPFQSKGDFIRRFLNFGFIISYIASFLLVFCCYFSGASELYKFILFAKAIKVILGFVLMVIFTIRTAYLDTFMGILYLLYLASQDFAILYYLGIFLKRLGSTKYDEYGVQITTKAQEKV